MCGQHGQEGGWGLQWHELNIPGFRIHYFLHVYTHLYVRALLLFIPGVQ